MRKTREKRELLMAKHLLLNHSKCTHKRAPEWDKFCNAARAVEIKYQGR